MRFKHVTCFWALCCIVLASTQNSWAQKITASDSTGCAPFVGIVFTGVSAASNISWDFGDGGSAGINNPTHTFSKAGSYTVKYTAIVSGSNVSQTIPIKVFGKPTPKHTTSDPKQGCVPLTIHFVDQSTGGGGIAIKTWEWAYGDGGINSANTSSPTYIYTLAGQFDVSLKITDANGCDSSLVIKKYISTSKKPSIVVTNTALTACVPPLSVTFNGTGTTSNSTSGNALAYLWKFGNGSTSTILSPSVVTYTANGTFPVKFIVTDNNSCSDSVSKSVVIGKPFSSFNVKDTVCKTVSFTNNSIGGVPVWNFGDGSPVSSQQNPIHTYTAGGSYSVTLQTVAGACIDDTIRKFFVEDIKAKFTSAPTYMCDLPAPVNYINQSTNATSWNWFLTPSVPYIVATPSVSILQNPVIVFSNRDTNQYSIYKELYVEIKLVVTSLHGCKDSISISKFDTINLPTARFMPNKTEGCVPLTVQFSDSSISKEKIVNWKYVFGDGSEMSGTNSNPNHTYSVSGTYYAKLIIQNSKGCLDTSYSIKIVVGKIPGPDFSALPLNVCSGVPVQFTDLTPLSDSIDTWHYSTDGSFMMSGCPGVGNPSWSFISTTGSQNVTLTVGSKGCYSSVTKNGYINVKGPLAQFRTATDCDSPRVYVFVGTLQDADSWTWDLGDGTILSNSTSQQIKHTYALSGNYKVRLTAINNTSGCPASVDTATAYVRQIKAKLQNVDSIFCSGLSIPFDASASKDVNPECNSGYYWIWGDGTGPGIYSSSTANHIFSSSGFMNVKLIVKDINGCRDTVVQKVKASGLSSKFKPDKLYGCLPLVVNFVDQSVSDTTITNWNWNFGNGSTSTLQNPSYTFAVSSSSSFVVTESVSNVLGCTNTYSVLIKISKPDPTFTASKTTLCSGDSVRFTPTFKNHPSYLWDFGDGSTGSTANLPYHVFKKSGDYAVVLQVKDSIGCSDIKSIVNYIHVQDYPTVDFTTPAAGSPNCYPLTATFTDISKVNVFQSRIWDFGNNSPTVTNATVGTLYQFPGTYSVSLTVVSTYGCTSKLTKTVKVNGPLADFSFSPSVICKGSSVQFKIKDTTRVFTYHWDFGDGYDTTALSPVSHVFNHHPPNGQAIITLIVWSDDSSCSHPVTHNISVHQVTADFNRNNEIALADTAHCLGVLDVFTNNSTNANPVWSWNFGDGAVSNLQSPSHSFTTPGTYSVQLSIANSQLGCVDTLIKKMIIFPNPTIKVTGGDTCIGSPVQISATGGTSYNWTPSEGLSSTSISNPIATSTITTDYSVIVKDNNGCTSVGNAHVYIQQQPRQIDWDTSIVIGQSLTLSAAYQGANFTYSWSPADSLSCSNCGIPSIVKPITDKYFTVTVSDSMGCFRVESHLRIHILPKSSLDVPTAFTPNGDGINDVVYVGGWGIKKLIEFKIYNRWGELLFISNNLSDGWDGKYKGVTQNIETYAYTVIAETYIDKEPLTKKGYIKIIK
jgi:gliding motility-associated-like protein